MLSLLHIVAYHTVGMLAMDAVDVSCADVRQADVAWVAQVNHWLERQTSHATGLIRSYEKTINPDMTRQASIYDLAIAAIYLAETCQVNKAVAVMDALERMWAGRGLPNVVDAELAAAGLETVVHTGPNAWVALASYRVYLRGHHHRHLELAMGIADWIAGGLPMLRRPAVAGVPWVEFKKDDGFVRAPAMGPARALAASGDLVAWDRIVSTEHALDTFALLRLLVDDPQVNETRKRGYDLALREVSNYLEVAATDPDCLSSLGSTPRRLGKGATGERDRICLATGGLVDDREIRWNPQLNASDVYYWWVAAVPPEQVWSRDVPARERILDAANARFEQSVAVETERGEVQVYGSDYVSCSANVHADTCGVLPCAQCKVMEPGACASKPQTARHDEPGSGESRPDGGFADSSAVGAVPGLDAGDQSMCQTAQPVAEPVASFFPRTRPLVSVEWTGEAILANAVLAEEHVSRPEAFAAQRDKLLSGMEPLERREGGALSYPYASHPCACIFNGGWLTPAPREGSMGHGLAGSVAGTVWMALGRLGINPFVKPKGYTYPWLPSLVDLPPAAAEVMCPAPSELAGPSVESLLAAAWACLKTAKQSPELDETLLDRADEFATKVLASRLGDLTRTPLEFDLRLSELAARQQLARTAEGRVGCGFQDTALDSAATALLLRAEVAALKGRGDEACALAAEIRRLFPDACLYTPRAAAGEPFDRFVPNRWSSWEIVGDPPRLRSGAFHVPIASLIGKSFPACAAGLRAYPWADDHWLERVPGFVEVEAQALYADNLFYSANHSGINVARGEGHLGLVWSWQPGKVSLTLPIYAYARAITSAGAAPLDEVAWLQNHSLGAGLDLRLGITDPPSWLRGLDIRASLRAGRIGYQTSRAASVSDMEAVATLRAWLALYWPVRRWHGVWAEAAFGGYGGQLTQWSVGQTSLWLNGAATVGARLFHVVEPYGLASWIANPFQHTDWDNNLRLGAGARVPLLKYSGASRRQMSIRLDANWQHTVAFWRWVDYVPSFRPLDDLRISTDFWLGWD